VENAASLGIEAVLQGCCTLVNCHNDVKGRAEDCAEARVMALGTDRARFRSESISGYLENRNRRLNGRGRKMRLKSDPVLAMDFFPRKAPDKRLAGLSDRRRTEGGPMIPLFLTVP
jgi:hypothetical protein